MAAVGSKEETLQGDLDLPEHEFTYLAGSTDRPWHQFIGRWDAMRRPLQEMLALCGTEQPLRVVDVGSCTGFFSLQAAHRHPEADVVGVEGSVGVGNGTAGTHGTTRQILQTNAVQTHLRWIRRLNLPNCFVAPEVWDYQRVKELASQGRPIGDVMFWLSVVHHIDTVSVQQYSKAGLSRLDGVTDLIAKMLLLSPRHFVELPNRPWMAAAYDAYHTARGVLEAAAKASGKRWRFRGPIHTAEWFGPREVWILEAEDPMPSVDVQSSPFPQLFRGDEIFNEQQPATADTALDSALGDLGDGFVGHAGGAVGGIGLWDDTGLDAASLAGPAEGGFAEGLLARSTLVDPGLLTLSGHCDPVEDEIGQALAAAPTSLLLAHLALRDAVAEAQDLLREVRTQKPEDSRTRYGPPAGTTSAAAVAVGGGSVRHL